MLKHDVVTFRMYITSTPVYFRYIVNLVSMVYSSKVDLRFLALQA